MNFYEKTAHELHDMLIKKQATSVEITKAIIERANNTEQYIDCYLERTNQEALDTAEATDKKIANNENITQLEGVPTALKDNICTDGIKTTCASKMLENFVPFYDAFVVKKLKSNNIPILGKLNMDEFAMGSSTETSYFKTTKNPYDPTRTPGGSSGGPASAVSAGSAVFALGSDTGGSARQPASFCGVVGLKPTYGLVSRFGLTALASSLDQISTITKDVTDCANLLNVIAGHDELDTTSCSMPKVDYTKALAQDIKNMKIAIISDCINENIDEQVKSAFLSAADVFKTLGALVSDAAIASLEYSLAAYHIITAAEASSNLAKFDGIRFGYQSPDYRDLVDLYESSRSIGFGSEVKRRIIAGTVALSANHYKYYFEKAQKVRTLICNDYKELFKKYDVLITPTTLGTAFKLGEYTENTAKMQQNDFCTASVSLAGLPAISIPCGFDSNGLPIGLQIIGNAFCETQVLKAAHAFESSTNFHQNRAIIRNKEGKQI